jgi:chromosome segregation ATPase
VLQRELTSKVQRIDTLQAELNATQADKAAAEATAAEARDQAAQLQSSLAQAQRQVDILGNNTDSKETQLQQLKAELDSANNAKTGLELQVHQSCCAAVCTYRALVCTH